MELSYEIVLSKMNGDLNFKCLLANRIVEYRLKTVI